MGNTTNILALGEWLDDRVEPLVISGPCSAESPEQLLATARLLAQNPYVKAFRAGVWKPRTRPGAFEGAGSKALSWLKDVRDETGLPIAVEVANPEHVAECLKHGIDILWVGARTVVNPFSMQAIAESLRGVDIPVMIKNPVNPDVKLWLGAIERVLNSGINKIAAIHRGFDIYQKTAFRNAPMWEIPIELKRCLPEIPIIVDPSHICGRRDLIADVSQKAYDLDMNGLMIECHYNPDVAMTDAEQQLTPDHLFAIVDNLIIRNQKGDQECQHRLESLRSEIDKIDRELVHLLSNRMKVTEEIGKYKKEKNITILQLKRWANIMNDRLELGSNMNLDQSFLQRLLNLIHKESISVQTEILKNKTR